MALSIKIHNLQFEELYYYIKTLQLRLNGAYQVFEGMSEEYSYNPGLYARQHFLPVEVMEINCAAMEIKRHLCKQHTIITPTDARLLLNENDNILPSDSWKYHPIFCCANSHGAGMRR